MSSQSEYAGTAGTKNFHTGNTSWTSASNSTGAADSSYATNAVGHNQTTDSLDSYNFGFSIPGGATINGVSATWTALKTNSNQCSFYNPGTYIEAGSTSGAFTANSLNLTALTTSSATYTTGSSSDLAGLTSQLTVSNINSNVENTGITIGAVFESTAVAGATAEVDSLQCTIYYTASSPPPTPTGLAVTNDSTNPTTVLDISWNASAGATSYNLLQASTLGGSFSVVQTGISGTSTTVGSLTAGTEYAFEIEAVGSGGTSAASSAVAWATEPAAPTGLTLVSSTATSITVSFTQSSVGSNIGIASNGCRYETPVGAGNWVNAGTVSNPFTISGLSPLTQYGIEVATTIQSTNGDFAGTILGPWSAELAVITPPFGRGLFVNASGPAYAW